MPFAPRTLPAAIAGLRAVRKLPPADADATARSSRGGFES